MKRIITIFIFLVIQIPSLVAQQNFFNVPSSEITQKGKLLYQGQVNITSEETEINNTFSYGLGKDLEVGINIFEFTFDPKHHFHFEHNDTLPKSPVYPLVLLNIQKAFELLPDFQLSIGTQNGLNPARHMHWVNYTYLNLAYEIPGLETRLVAGAYTFNKAFVGDWRGNEETSADNKWGIGFQAGIQQPIIKEKLLFTADFLSHRHKLGESAWGLAYYITKSWVLSMGYQLPNPGSLSNKGLIFEITRVPE
ncbi:hypothetical protein [Xanthocytophaga agilis]|uniref:Transporter n=1 Tax=Xanthocytophaga agilis TaxID=3048010 RepID=A0AAE3UEM9_9BACT|nr:hypothetical protein [Xanthocytophaga agilis]MDJ1502948.1 hypothetical protein [Xanthocytophaga agilis]